VYPCWSIRWRRSDVRLDLSEAERRQEAPERASRAPRIEFGKPGPVRESAGRWGTWSQVEAVPRAIAETQAYALRQLDAVAESLEREPDKARRSGKAIKEAELALPRDRRVWSPSAPRGRQGR
jgi:hypothetical protein